MAPTERSPDEPPDHPVDAPPNHPADHPPDHAAAQPPDHPVARAMALASRPATGLAGRYGHPVHPALVAVPIGAWVASFCFDLASHLVAEPQFLAQGSRWLIAIGVLGALLAAMAGFLDLLSLPAGSRVLGTALVHMSLALAATTGYAVGFVIRGDEPAAPVPVGALLLSAVSLAALGGAGYLGGSLAYRYGVRVADEATQAEGYIDSKEAR